MSKNIFISYSRREVPFVDTLAKDFGDSAIQTWVDYQNLIPGKPWLDQILAGIHDADIFLLVVSRSSIDSKNVELEYQHALELGKRILLVIFEAVPLPPALQTCEWIDFRGPFEKKYKQLLAQLDKPHPQAPAPQHGFKTSFTVWFTIFISLLTVAVSIPGWWTIFIPILLIPLPLGILKRDFNFYRARFGILTLPAILFLSVTFFQSYQFTKNAFISSFVISCLTVPILLSLLSSKGMRVWGKPAASAPRTARPYQLEIEHPEPVSFFIEYAPEDEKYAEAISNGLTKFGHTPAASEQAQVNLAIISDFKNTISIDPELHVVFPIIVQDTVIEDGNIQRIQWIDFRRGLRNLDSLASLLPRPEKLMKALGVVPISGQSVYPRIIQMLDYFLTLLAFFSISIWFPLSLEFGKQFLQTSNSAVFVVINIVLSAIILHTVSSARRALVSRKGRLASLGSLIGSLFWVSFIGFFQYVYIEYTLTILETAAQVVMKNDLRGTVAIFLPCSFGLGVILIGLFGILNRGDLTRWFPQRQKK